MMHFLGSKMYSIGSSIVMMCSVRFRLMRSIIEARVVDLPCPTGPTTRKNPCSNCVKVSRIGGRLSSVKVLMFFGMRRKAIATVPCSTNALPRKRP